MGSPRPLLVFRPSQAKPWSISMTCTWHRKGEAWLRSAAAALPCRRTRVPSVLQGQLEVQTSNLAARRLYEQCGFAQALYPADEAAGGGRVLVHDMSLCTDKQVSNVHSWHFSSRRRGHAQPFCGGSACVWTTGDPRGMGLHLPRICLSHASARGSLRSIGRTHGARQSPVALFFRTAGSSGGLLGTARLRFPAMVCDIAGGTTWNYAAVHVYGRPNIVEDTKLASRALQEMVEFFESDLATPWPGGLPDDYRSSMMQGIVVFTIDELRWRGSSSSVRTEVSRTATGPIELSRHRRIRRIARWLR